MSFLLLLLILLVIVFAALIISALRNRVIFTMGIRNIGRRKGNTVIVIIGLMIGTAIITASLVIGDTMQNMVDNMIVEGMGEVDLMVVDITSETNRTYLPYDNDTTLSYTTLREEILEIPHVEGVSGEFTDGLPVGCIQSRQSEPGMLIMGVNSSELTEFGGLKVNGKTIDFDLDDDEVYLNERAASDLDVKAGYYIQIYNATSNVTGPQQFIVKEIVDSDGYANWNIRSNIIVNLEVAWRLFDVDNVVNTIKITNEGDKITGARYSDEVEEALQPILEDYPNLETMGNKQKLIDSTREQVKQFTDLFLVFSTFTIIAGVILIINIFVMLAEERKREMGISRAIGMKRRHLKRMFLFEGGVYAVIAGLVGVLFGLVIAYLALWAIRDIEFGPQGYLLQYYTFTIPSLTVSFIAGFLITIATIFLVTGRISRLNIVRAIRKIPEPLVPRKDTRMTIIGIVLLILSILLLMMGVRLKEMAPTWAGLSLIIYSVGILSRRYIGDRAAFSISSILVLIQWMQPFEILQDYSSGMEMFIVSGLFVVSSSVALIMFNSDTILNSLISLGSRKKASQAVFKIAVSYPLKNKFRTGMTIMIFGLIIFTIVVLSMIVNIFNVNIDKTIEEQSGGFDIVAYSSGNIPIDDIRGEIDANQNLSLADFEAVYSLSSGYAKISNEDENSTDVIFYTVIGCGEGFIENNGYTFSEYSEEFHNDREVWEALLTHPDHIVIDGSVLPQEYGPSFGLITVNAGDTIALENDTGRVEFQVIGILKETFIHGIFMHDHTAEEVFDISDPSIFMFKLKDASKDTAIARDLEREFFRYGLQPIVISDMVQEFTKFMNQFFNLFTAFLGAGLIIGVSALGIITLRSVHERRLEIGVMRAIGFKRKMVTKSFLFEATLIALWGMIIGTIHGIYVGWYIWRQGFQEQDFIFTIAWMRIGIVLLITLVFTLICVLPPSHQASKVQPAEALRFE